MLSMAAKPLDKKGAAVSVPTTTKSSRLLMPRSQICRRRHVLHEDFSGTTSDDACVVSLGSSETGRVERRHELSISIPAAVAIFLGMNIGFFPCTSNFLKIISSCSCGPSNCS